MKKGWICVLACFLLFAGLDLHAQDLEDDVSNYLSKNGQLYLQPLADIFCANLNSGLFHTARIPKFGLHLYIGLEGMMAPVSDDQKTFTTVSEEGSDLPGGVETATVFGSEEGAVVEIEGEPVQLPGGWDTKWVPFAVPHLTVGSLMGTEATIRWFEMEVGEDIGRVKLFGWGLRHSLSQYIPLIPVDIALGYYRQSFDVGDLVEARTTYLGLQASYQVGVLCLYGGVGLESSSLDIHYTYEEDEEETEVSFELEGANRGRFTLGFALDLPVVKIHADMNLAKQMVYTLGIGFGF
jgi:hypothetical protein